jgi:hypothetical protein
MNVTELVFQCCVVTGIYKEPLVMVFNIFQNQRTAGSGSLGNKTNPRMKNQQWVLIADCTKVPSLHFCVIKDYKRKMGTSIEALM